MEKLRPRYFGCCSCPLVDTRSVHGRPLRSHLHSVSGYFSRFYLHLPVIGLAIDLATPQRRLEHDWSGSCPSAGLEAASPSTVTAIELEGDSCCPSFLMSHANPSTVALAVPPVNFAALLTRQELRDRNPRDRSDPQRGRRSRGRRVALEQGRIG
jgi:hypothetical protein